MNENGQELLQLIERIEQCEAEKKAAVEDQKEVLSEAKSRGYDTAILRKIVAIRKRDRDELAEEQALIDLYLSAISEP